MSGRLTSPDSSRLKATSAKHMSYSGEHVSQTRPTRHLYFPCNNIAHQLTAFKHFTAELPDWEVPRQPARNSRLKWMCSIFPARTILSKLNECGPQRQQAAKKCNYRLLWWSSNKVMPVKVMCHRDSDSARFSTITLMELKWNDSSWEHETENEMLSTNQFRRRLDRQWRSILETESGALSGWLKSSRSFFHGSSSPEGPVVLAGQTSLWFLRHIMPGISWKTHKHVVNIRRKISNQ